MNIHINLFPIWSDVSNAYRSYRKSLFELVIQTNKRKRKRQLAYQVFRVMPLNEDHEFRLPEATMMTNNQNYLLQVHFNACKSLLS